MSSRNFSSLFCSTFSCLIIAVLIVMISMSPVSAQGQGGGGPPIASANAPEIFSAIIDFDAGEIMIEGIRLHDGVEPEVTLANGAPLTVLRFNAADETTVTVTLPSVDDGTHLLKVTNGFGTGEFDLAVGTIGPQGIQGEQGPPGSTEPALPSIIMVQNGLGPNTDTPKAVNAVCPEGTVRTGGGARVGSASVEVSVKLNLFQNHPFLLNDRLWHAAALAPADVTIPWVLDVFVLCMSAHGH